MSKDNLFNVWMNRVSSIIQKESGGLDPETISDFNYRDAFDENRDAQEVAEEVLTSNGLLI